jgi:hypothetical protein
MPSDDDLLVMFLARGLDERLQLFEVARVDMRFLARHGRSIAPIIRSSKEGISVTVSDPFQAFCNIIEARFPTKFREKSSSSVSVVIM